MKLVVLCIAFTLDFVTGAGVNVSANTDPFLNSVQIIQKYGYPAESHTTVTEDGYILELHRIPHGREFDPDQHRTPILVQHGLLGSSADFLLIGPERAFPDDGYDVWLGNIRGNTYSRAHINLTANDRQFWDFSWHESAIYDLSAEIDFVCNYTQHNEIIYTGFSMGTTMFFVLTSTRPEYQEKIRGAVLLAAVGFLQNTRVPFRVFAPLGDYLQVLSDYFTNGELIQQSGLYRLLVRLGCTLNNFERNVCTSLIFLYTGSDPSQFDQVLLPNILNHIPAGASTKSLTHYAQLIQSGEFRQYDYGTRGNNVRYGRSTPPSYNVEAINTPIYIFEGQNDFLSTLPDVNRLVERMPSVINVEIVNYSNFTHLDFILSRDVKTLLYDRVLEVLESFLY